MADYTTKVIFDMTVRTAQATAEVNRLQKAFANLAKTGTVGATAAPQKLPWLEQLAKDVQAAEIQYFGLRRLSYGLQSTGRDFTNAGMSIIRTMQSMATEYLDFADAATRAGIAMELPIEMQGKLRDSVQDTSEVLGAFDANEIMEQLRVWVAGTGEAIDSEERLNVAIENTTEIMRLAAINNVNAGKTIEYVGAAMKEFGKTAEDIPDIISQLNYVAAKTFANVNDLGESLKFVGPQAHSMGIALEEVVTVLGFLADANIKGSMAGRALRQMLMGLSDPSKQAADELDRILRINEELGESWRDVIWPGGEFVGLAQTIDILAAAYEGMDNAQKTASLGTIFTTNAITSAMQLLNVADQGRVQNINVLRAAQKEMEGIIDAEVLAYQKLKEEVTGMPQTIQNAVDLWTNTVADWLESDSAKAANLANRWKNAITDIGAIVFQEGIGPLEQLVEVFRDLADVIEENPALVKGGIQFGLAAIGIGAATTQLGKFLQALTNILIVAKLLEGQVVLSTLLGLAGPITLGLGGLALATQVESVQEAINRAAREQAVIPGLAPIMKEGPVEPWAWEAAARTAKEAALAWKYPEELPGVTRFEPLPEVPALTLKDLEKKYGDVLDAYDKHLERLADKQEAFDKRTLSMEEDHQEDLLALSEQRVEGRIDLIDTYEGRVEDVWRSYYRSMELAERSHQDRMLDIVEDGIERRIEVIEDQAERLADTVASYELSVEDAWESYYYSEAVAAEDAAYRRQKIIDDYNEWEAEQLEKLSEEKVDETEDLNKRLLRLHEDYLTALERRREDHLARMMDLIAKRDARAMLTEIRDFNKWLKRREEDYLKSKQRASEITKESFEEEREERKRNLEEELADFDKAQARRQEKAKKAFERRLFLMERSHKRELEKIKKRNAEELKDLAEMIVKRQKLEKEAHSKTLARMKEAHEYQLSEMKREHGEVLREYDVETAERTDRLEANHRKVMEKRLTLHEKEMKAMRDEARDVLEEQYDALDYDDARLEAIFYERLQKFLKYLGRELDIVSEYYAKRVNAMAEVWSDVGITSAVRKMTATPTTVVSDLGIAGVPYMPATTAPTYTPTTVPSTLGVAGVPYMPTATPSVPSTLGIAGVPYMPSVAPSAAQGTYTVKAGDTLGEIASRFGVSYMDIARASGISDPSLIYPGQVLTIPGVTTTPSVPSDLGIAGMPYMPTPTPSVPSTLGIAGVSYMPSGAPTAPAPTAATRLVGGPQESYTVKSGETLGEIANRYGLSYMDIARASGISDPDRIYPGQVLTIPSGQPPIGGIAPTAPTISGAVPFQDLYVAAAAAQGLDWSLLAGQGRVESVNFDPYYVYGPGVSPAGAQGVAQFMPGTWPSYGGTGDPFDPKDAIPAQAKYMKWLEGYMRSKGKSPAYDWAIMGYLHGQGGALRYSSLSSFPSSSRGYLANIKKYAAEYRAAAGLASGGLVTQPGLYSLAELGPELVLPADWTKQILQMKRKASANYPETAGLMPYLSRGASKRGQTPSSLSITVRQENWRFEGSFTAADKRWFRSAAEQAAYVAVEKVVQEASSGN